MDDAMPLEERENGRIAEIFWSAFIGRVHHSQSAFCEITRRHRSHRMAHQRINRTLKGRKTSQHVRRLSERRIFPRSVPPSVPSRYLPLPVSQSSSIIEIRDMCGMPIPFWSITQARQEGGSAVAAPSCWPFLSLFSSCSLSRIQPGLSLKQI